jgi:hypothetical protein
MGHEANLLLVDEQGYKLFYCHWCANTLYQSLFWGPDYSIPFIEQQQLEANNGWLTARWVQGGVVLDIYRRVLLLFDEDSLNDIPLHRIYMALLQEVWKGWEVRWAYEGIFNMADYVGYPRAKVRARHSNYAIDDRWLPGFWSVENDFLLHTDYCVASVKFGDENLRLFTLSGSSTAALVLGTKILDIMNYDEGLRYLDLNNVPLDNDHLDIIVGAGFPQSGFHIDITQHQIAFWTADYDELRDRIVPAWFGWEVIWLQDRYEFQLEHTNGKLIFPIHSDEALLSELEKRLLGTNKSNSLDLDVVDFLQRIVDDETKQGHVVDVNPRALGDHPQDTNLIPRQQIFNQAVANWRRKLGQNKGSSYNAD